MKAVYCCRHQLAATRFFLCVSSQHHVIFRNELNTKFNMKSTSAVPLPSQWSFDAMFLFEIHLSDNAYTLTCLFYTFVLETIRTFIYITVFYSCFSIPNRKLDKFASDRMLAILLLYALSYTHLYFHTSYLYVWLKYSIIHYIGAVKFPYPTHHCS